MDYLFCIYLFYSFCTYLKDEEREWMVVVMCEEIETIIKKKQVKLIF